jgi:limonene-1,2-epoxide hydrolase
MQRQAPHFSDLHCEILNVASSGSTVFVQRLDSMTTKNGPLKSHLVAVLEFDPAGKIRVWREYYDSKEITTQVGAGMTTAGQRA